MEQVNEYRSGTSFTPKEIEAWRKGRWLARTNLGWLCRNVLGYKHVSDNSYQPGDEIDEGPHLPIHQPLIDTVQKFPVPTPQQYLENDQYHPAKGWTYKPILPLQRLPGKRRTLILDFRGSLKTTINTMAHAIQWIINYPDIAIMVVQSNGGKAEAFIGEIKAHFIGNPKFRQLFPEHCPQGNRINDFGTRVQFTTCARGPHVIRKEPTVLASSIEKGMAGIHVDVIKCSDIVDPSNINGQGLQDVKRAFNYLKPLLVSPNYWIDVEGTRYHTDDTYGAIIESELTSPPEEREYQMYVRSCYQRITPDGKPEKFDVAGLKLPFKLDTNGKPISWWPERFKPSDYEKMRRDDPFVFATQQLNDPSAAGEFKPFPVTPGKYPVYITRKDFQQRVLVSHREIIVDTAATNNKRSDYTVLTVVAWDKGFGRAYVERIIRGRFTTDQIINHIVALMLEFKPLKLKIEKNLHVLGMESSLKRALQRTAALENVHVKLDLIPRDNQTAKEERIQTALQPWYMSGDIRFLDDLDRWCPGVTKALETELEDFPSAKNDDILDTLADIFQNKKYFGRENKRLTHEEIAGMRRKAFDRLADQELHRWGVGGAEESQGEGYFL